MERILTTAQMKNADKFTIEKLGVDESTLIERAGTAVYEEIIKRFRGGRVLVCVGKGNNGKDGQVIYEKLNKTHGFSAQILSVYNGIFKMFDTHFDIIVDCIFGTGLNRQVEGVYKTAIEKINTSNSFVVSVDIPSGLNGDTGLALGVSVKANLTVAIGEYKLGHFLNDGLDYCGEVILKDIGISVWDEDFIERLNGSDASQVFLKRKRNVNKGNFPKVCIMGGSKKYSGSVLLSLNALTALKTGSGYSTLAVPESLFSSYLGLNPECILMFIKDKDGNVVFDEENLKNFLTFDAIAIGMGMGVSNEVYKIIEFLLKNYDKTLIIDADGLNSIAKFGVDILKDKKCKVVLTPHIKEFSRLSGCEKEVIFLDLVKSAKEFALNYGCIVVLKSASSVITDGDRVILNTTGTNALAKAGSGDTLTGIILGSSCLSNDLLNNVASANYVFGLSSEIATKEDNEYTVTASDVVKCLGKAISSL